MNRKEIKSQTMITIQKFLRDYYEVDNEEVINKLSKLSHKDLKYICHEVYGLNINSISFEDVTIDSIKCGQTLLVRDGFGNPAPYLNPLSMYFNESVDAKKAHK